MPLFSGKHFSNPAVGRAHGEEEGGMEKKAPTDGMKAHHSMHAHFHDDGTAHTHIHHADGQHEHTDHATHEEAHDHLKMAMDGMGGEQPQDEEGSEPEHETMHSAARMSGGAY